MNNDSRFYYDFASEIVSDPRSRTIVRGVPCMANARIQLAGVREPSRRIMNRLELELYCRGLLDREAMESFRIICVDAQCRLLGESEISSGNLSEVSAYPRKIVAAAILMNAHSVFFTHNHPGGTCAPSAEDIVTTKTLVSLLNKIGIQVLDHMIVAGSACYSMKQHGDF